MSVPEVTKTEHEYCGYSNCFRPFYKMRGFMPTCKLHYHNPKKWNKELGGYTGSIWHKKEVGET